MKLATKILSLFAIVGLATFYVGCGPDGGQDKSEEEKQLIKLASTWALQTATEDGQPRTDFTNLVLTITGTFAQNGTYNYSFTGTRPNPSPWPVNGTWKFDPSNILTKITRDPGTSSETQMDYTVTDTQLTLSFNVPDGSTGWAGGTSRAKSVTGDWVFVFTKQ
jgi:hypothetical protein